MANVEELVADLDRRIHAVDNMRVRWLDKVITSEEKALFDAFKEAWPQIREQLTAPSGKG